MDLPTRSFSIDQPLEANNFAPAQAILVSRLNQTLAQIGSAMLFGAALLSSDNTWRISSLGLTPSDLFFFGGLAALVVSRRLPKADDFWGIGAVGMLLFLFGLTLSSAVRGSLVTGVVDMAQYVTVWLLLPLAILLLPDRSVKWVAIAAIIGMLLNATWGLAVYFLLPSYSHGLLTGPLDRLASLIGDPNAFAKVLTLHLPLILLAVYRHDIPRFLGAAIAAVLLIAIGLSGSVGGMIVLATVATVVLTYGRIPTRAGLVIVLGAAAAGIFLWLVQPQALMSRIITPLTQGQLGNLGTAEKREGLVVESIQFINQHPFIGFGGGMYSRYSVSGKDVHSLPFLIWAEGGLIALAGLVTMGASWVAQVVRRNVQGGIPSAAALSVTAGLVVISLGNTQMYARFWYYPLLLTLRLASMSHAEAGVHA